ncbi:plasmid partition protein ParG [Citrobacter braakii]|uniref:plasmid partition protein ParG n=1 Tax=Citrobacter braakii TaxID=57706 RepID=UPI0034E4ED35
MAKDKRDYLIGKKALQVFLSEETHLKFKMICTMRGQKMSQVIEKMVDDYVLEESNKIDWLTKAIRDQK